MATKYVMHVKNRLIFPGSDDIVGYIVSKNGEADTRLSKKDALEWAKALANTPNGTNVSVRKNANGIEYLWAAGGLPIVEILKPKSQTPLRFRCPTRSMTDLANNLHAESVIDSGGKQKHRTQLKNSLDVFCSNPTNKMLGIYGLRRTGKSILMRSKALELMQQGKSVVYFDFEFNKNAKFSELMADLMLCRKSTVQYVFIDEITFLSKVVTASLTGEQLRIPEFPLRGNEIYANLSAYGVHVIVSGTDSYCLPLAKGDVLYDRMILLSTTHIPYREYVYLTGRASIIDYLDNGGILQREDMVIWDEYVKTAIINNVVYSIGSLRTMSPKYRFLRLRDEEVKQLILYVLMDTSIEFFEHMFESLYTFPDLTDGVANLRRRKENATTFPADFIDKIRDRIEDDLGLKQLDKTELRYYHTEIEEIMKKLDLITSHKLHRVTDARKNSKLDIDVYALSIPGLRTYQLMKTLWAVEAEVHNDVTIDNKVALLTNIKQSAEGHKLEGVVLSEVMRSLPQGYTASQYNIYNDESDMVIENISNNEVCLFEIKRSSELVRNQAKHYLESDSTKNFMAHYPDKTIKSCNVLYTGKTLLNHRFEGVSKNVNFISVTEFLSGIFKWIQYCFS